MKVLHVVTVFVRDSDADLLDRVADELPADDAEGVGPEYDGPERHVIPDTDLEVLDARVSYEATENTADSDLAADLYVRLSAMDLSGADEYRIRHYRSPTGGVTPQEVQDWYADHPDQRPFDDEGETYTPTSWSADRHVVNETQG